MLQSKTSWRLDRTYCSFICCAQLTPVPCMTSLPRAVKNYPILKFMKKQTRGVKTEETERFSVRINVNNFVGESLVPVTAELVDWSCFTMPEIAALFANAKEYAPMEGRLSGNCSMIFYFFLNIFSAVVASDSNNNKLSLNRGTRIFFFAFTIL